VRVATLSKIKPATAAASRPAAAASMPARRRLSVLRTGTGRVVKMVLPDHIN
jgi:hypothetical protein